MKSTAPTPGTDSATRPAPFSEPIYTATFWIAYIANVAIVAANALTFRFAEMVIALGGKEQTAGTIVGVATAVALGSRLFLGQAIDRYGVSRLWRASALLFTAGAVSLAFAGSLGWPIYAARSLFAIGLAGGLTCSAVHIQNLVPAHRRTEVLGSLGSSGFVGLIAGSVSSDLLFGVFTGSGRFYALFGTAAALGALYSVFVVLLTRNENHSADGPSPALHQLVFRYWPGNVMLVAFAMGLVQAVTTVFLTRFATERELSGLGPFFAAYAISAFSFRIISRSWSRWMGRHRMILFGLIGHCAGLVSLPLVHTEWQFTLPAIAGGFGHALLFPAVVSLGSEAFPLRYRGTGTTLIFGLFDVGMFASAPVLGGIIDSFDGRGFVPMFLTSSAFVVSVAVLYQLTSARRFDSDLATPGVESKPIAAERPSVAPAAVPAEALAQSASEADAESALVTVCTRRQDAVNDLGQNPSEPRRAAIGPAVRCR